MKKNFFLVLLGLLFVVPSVAMARVGVGVATGKIIIHEELNPGEIYLLPNFSVVNTGDQTTNYEVTIEYLQGKEELDPGKEWFSMKPQKFTLDPENVQNVEVKLNVPVKAIPGNYFAFVEAHPVKDAETPGASINIAAASKLYFTVKPANIFQGLYYKTISFFVYNAPWSYIVLALLLLATIITFFKKNFSLNISVGKKTPESMISADHRTKEPIDDK